MKDLMEKKILKIVQDDHPESPREWSNLGTMVCWHRSYTLGDEQPGIPPEEYELPEDAIVLDLYLYDHGGLTISTTPFSCPFDSGKVGFIFATPEKAREFLQLKEGEDLTRRAIEVLQEEVKTYDKYLRGEVYGFVIRSKCECCGQATGVWDSCYGFLGETLEETGMWDQLGDGPGGYGFSKEAVEKAWENRFED